MTERHMLDIVHHQNPVTLTPADSAREACALMSKHGVGAILVVDENRQLAGIFTGRDAVARIVARGLDATKTPLKEVMTAAPITMQPGSTASDALLLMQDGGFRHVPVVDGERVIGIVSKGDFRGLEQAHLDEQTELWERV